MLDQVRLFLFIDQLELNLTLILFISSNKKD